MEMDPAGLRTSMLGKTEKKTTSFSRYVTQVGDGIYKCHDFIINSHLLQSVRDVAAQVFPKISNTVLAAGPYVGKLKAVAVVGFVGAAAGMSRSLRYVRRTEGSERVNHVLKFMHYAGVCADNVEKLVLAAQTLSG